MVLRERATTMTNGHHLGAYIQRRLQELGGMSQQGMARAMARHLGYIEDDYVTATQRFQQQISRLIKGKSDSVPDPETLGAMAAALETTEDALLREIGFLRDDDEPEDEQRIWTAMMRDIDRLDLPPSLKAHMRQTAQFVRDLAEQERGDGRR